MTSPPVDLLRLHWNRLGKPCVILAHRLHRGGRLAVLISTGSCNWSKTCDASFRLSMGGTLLQTLELGLWIKPRTVPPPTGYKPDDSVQASMHSRNGGDGAWLRLNYRTVSATSALVHPGWSSMTCWEEAASSAPGMSWYRSSFLFDLVFTNMSSHVFSLFFAFTSRSWVTERTGRLIDAWVRRFSIWPGHGIEMLWINIKHHKTTEPNIHPWLKILGRGCSSGVQFMVDEPSIYVSWRVGLVGKPCLSSPKFEGRPLLHWKNEGICRHRKAFWNSGNFRKFIFR